MTSPEKLATPDSVMARLSEIEHSLWILREHQTLHFGDAHNTTMEATKAHLSVIALRTEVEALATQRQGEGETRDAALEQAANLVECEYAADATQGRRLAQIAQHIRDLKKRGV